MVRTYKRKQNVPQRNYSDEDLRIAVNEVKAGRLTIYRASREYNIPYPTVYTNVRGSRGKIQKSKGRPTCLPFTEEEKLANGLKTLEKWGFGLTRKEVLETVGEYVRSNNIKTNFKDGTPGEDWFIGFKKRHRLSLKIPQNVEYARKTAMDPFIIYDYFDILKETINHLNLHNTPERIWNLDESSLCIDPRKTKVVGAVNKPSSRTISTPGKENISILLMCNAAGGKAPPLIVYKGVNVWDQWMADEGKGYPGTVYAATKNGWMETEVFTNYFLKTILCTIGEQRPVLIIYDGHSTHISLALIERAIQENITILKLPPHTSHLLQPLDLAVFKPFKTKWDEKLVSWQRHHVGLKLPKKMFSQFLCQTWIEVSPEVVKSGFRKGGIVPLNKNVIPEEQFPPEALKRWKDHIAKKNSQPTPALPVENIATPRPSDENIAIAGPSSASAIIPVVPSENTDPFGQTNEQSAKLNASEADISFEHLLLTKVQQKPTPSKTKKRRVCPGTELVTSDEALQLMRDKDEMQSAKKRPKTSKKQPVTYSSDTDDELDNASPVYIDTDDDMDLEELLNSDYDEETATFQTEINRWVLVQYCTKKLVKHFVGQVIDKNEDGWVVKFTKYHKNQFVWPKFDDTDVIDDPDIVRVLPDPHVSRRGHFQFDVSFDNYHLI